VLLDSLALLSARMWGWHDDIGLVPLGSRLSWFGHASLEVEAELGWPVPVPEIAHDGWEKFAARAPKGVFEVVDSLRRDPAPLVDGLCETPMTFLHGDWKLGNLGIGADGRTVLIDWTYPGEGACCTELAWYLAVNRARMPQSKEDAIEFFRAALERHGIATDVWFDRQLGLSLLASLVIFGWEKALGDEDELRWWCDRAAEGARLL
jgi:thiamine kinase-like enzyme